MAKIDLETAKSQVEAAKAALVKAEAQLAKAEKASKKRKRDDSAVDMDALAKAVKKAKKAYKTEKNKDNKKALKAAKAALAEAEEAAKKKDESSDSSSSDDDEEEKAEEKSEEADLDAMMSSNNDSAPAAAASPANKVDNPTGCKKVFVGNLSFQIDEDTLKDFFKDVGGQIEDLHWLEDRDTGRFKGCGFVTFDNADAAAVAVGMTGQMLMERDIKVDFSFPKERKGNNGASKFANKPLSEKPAGCVTVFAGNLSFEIDDDAMRTFAEDCGEIAKIRWLTDRDSGDFKGCGFVEFYETEAVDKFVLKNGQDLMGRPIRLDYAKGRD